jgi:hypothetical protein
VRVDFEPSIDVYPSGLIPAPLFVYHVSDAFGEFDFGADGNLDTFILGDCVSLSDVANCGNGRLDPPEVAALQALTSANPSDLVDNFTVDARLATTPNVITRLQTRYPAMSVADAKQFIRDCIASISVELVVEEPSPMYGNASARESAPGSQYRYLQHDLSAEVYLPNAFMLSKNQLFYASQNLTNKTNDGTPGVGPNVYDPALCPPASKTNMSCWPIRP